MYQHLIAAHQNADGNTAGLSDTDINTFREDTTNDVVGWDRYNSSSPCTDDVVMIANLSSVNMWGTYGFGLPCGGTWKVVFNSDSTAYNSQFAGVGPAEGSTFTATTTGMNGYNYSTKMAIGKWSVIILALD
jgi:1,4-alpha-glucan branching enzyme